MSWKKETEAAVVNGTTFLHWLHSLVLLCLWATRLILSMNCFQWHLVTWNIKPKHVTGMTFVTILHFPSKPLLSIRNISTFEKAFAIFFHVICSKQIFLQVAKEFTILKMSLSLSLCFSLCAKFQLCFYLCVDILYSWLNWLCVLLFYSHSQMPPTDLYFNCNKI